MEQTQHRVRGAAGFTLTEAMIVVAIMAVMVGMAVPSISRYRTRQHARSHATRIMGILKEARSQAISSGQPVLVLFDDPANPTLAGALPGTFARVVRNTDGNYHEDPGDIVTDVQLDAGLSTDVTAYGLGAQTPYSSAAVPTGDPAGGTLGGLSMGASFIGDPDSGSNLPSVAFNPQGVAVTIIAPSGDPADIAGRPGSPGSGRGGFYVTDNHSAVYAVLLGPLGSVGIQSLNPESLQWN